VGGRAELLGGRLAGLRVELGDDDARALLDEAPGDGLADAEAGSRDDGDAALELTHGGLLTD